MKKKGLIKGKGGHTINTRKKRGAGSIGRSGVNILTGGKGKKNGKLSRDIELQRMGKGELSIVSLNS